MNPGNLPELVRMLTGVNPNQGDSDQGDTALKAAIPEALVHIKELLASPMPEGLGSVTSPDEERAKGKAEQARLMGFYPDVSFKSGHGWTVKAQWY